MGDDERDRETLKLCPVCGAYDVPRKDCKVCGGRGLVSLRQLDDYAARQTVKKTTSSLKDIPTQVRKAIETLKSRRTAQLNANIICGEVLLERAEKEPPSTALYTALSDWLSRVRPIINRER